MTYGIPALEARIFVAALLHTRYPPIWLLVQSEWNPFFDHLSFVTRHIRCFEVEDTWHIRFERPRTHNRTVMIHLRSRDSEPRIWADRFWRMPAPPILRQSRYPLIAETSVRMRLTWDVAKHPEIALRDRFHELVCQAIGAARQDRGGIVPAPPSESFTRRAHLVSLADRMLTDRAALMRNLCTVPAAHAALYGRDQAKEEDWRAAAHLLRSSIPIWMERLLRSLLRFSPKGASLPVIIKDTGYDDPWGNTGGAVGTKRDPIRLGEKLIRELWTTGLVERSLHYRYSIKPDYVLDLEHIVNGKL